MGYHIVPFQSHDENGSLVTVQSPLDFLVSIPVETRTPLRHMHELIAAITKASGTRVSWGVIGSPGGFDTEFLGQQAMLSHNDHLQWGVSEMSGRDALIDLFDKSATTFLWSLRCVSSPQPEDRFCAFNMRKHSVFVTDPVGDFHLKVFVFDRLSKLQPQ